MSWQVVGVASRGTETSEFPVVIPASIQSELGGREGNEQGA